ncbi:MAG TPA: 2-oxoglutarate and iron-dependent oxygenase domain-containing protein [Kineosporiaceae bacterium]|nr:2-oxoglutarate and iron-dependent oxygenase domain-containing protein [Kineosporiaceae bacterium]
MSQATTHPEILEIPTIDLSRFRDGTPEQRTAVAAQVDEAARTVGFMQVIGHAIPAEVESGLVTAMDEFFGLPMWQKKALRPASPDFNRGYTPPKSERLTLSLGVESSAADLFEAFNVGNSAEDFPGLGLDEMHYAPNLWPLRPASFEPAVQAWFGQAARVAREITTVMAVALGLGEHFFAGYQDHSLEVLRMNNYQVPPAPTQLEPGQVGMGAHTDYGIVTVLWADPILGLQILGRDGVWQDVVPADGALLVNLGDLLARWTNDRWVSTLHRVLPPTDAEGRLVRRRSAAFFHDGNADAVISCLPGCATPERPAQYESVSVADHLTAKLNGSRGLIANSGAEREAARLLSAQQA